MLLSFKAVPRCFTACMTAGTHLFLPITLKISNPVQRVKDYRGRIVRGVIGFQVIRIKGFLEPGGKERIFLILVGAIFEMLNKNIHHKENLTNRRNIPLC